MKNCEKLKGFRMDLESSKKTIQQENISLFVDFLNRRGFQKILEFCPDMDELIIEISFDKKDQPSMKLSDYMPLHGPSMFPFTQAFTNDVAVDIQNLEGTDDDIGIDVLLPVNTNREKTYEFRCYMPMS